MTPWRFGILIIIIMVFNSKSKCSLGVISRKCTAGSGSGDFPSYWMHELVLLKVAPKFLTSNSLSHASAVHLQNIL